MTSTKTAAAIFHRLLDTEGVTVGIIPNPREDRILRRLWRQAKKRAQRLDKREGSVDGSTD